jgi:pimeloyl-ACP methyl ester carboxylesterase
MALIPWLVAAYAGICAAAYFGNRLLMYIPDPARITPAEAGLEGVREIEIKVGDSVMLVAWHARAKENQPTILYFHGNGANGANRAAKIEAMRESGFGVFYLNNRGYGGSGGRPGRKNWLHATLPDFCLAHIPRFRNSWRARPSWVFRA